MRRIAFLPQAFQHYNEWSTTQRQIHSKVVELIKDIERHPFTGLGKPEPLKHHLKGLWGRRINDEHRLVYRVTDEEIIIVSCKFHYSK